MSDRDAFVLRIFGGDAVAPAVFADWLEDRGETDAAAVLRDTRGGVLLRKVNGDLHAIWETLGPTRESIWTDLGAVPCRDCGHPAREEYFGVPRCWRHAPIMVSPEAERGGRFLFNVRMAPPPVWLDDRREHDPFSGSITLPFTRRQLAEACRTLVASEQPGHRRPYVWPEQDRRYVYVGWQSPDPENLPCLNVNVGGMSMAIPHGVGQQLAEVLRETVRQHLGTAVLAP
jgi:hypothetical protein